MSRCARLHTSETGLNSRSKNLVGEMEIKTVWGEARGGLGRTQRGWRGEGEARGMWVDVESKGAWRPEEEIKRGGKRQSAQEVGEEREKLRKKKGMWNDVESKGAWRGKSGRRNTKDVGRGTQQKRSARRGRSPEGEKRDVKRNRKSKTLVERAESPIREQVQSLLGKGIVLNDHRAQQSPFQNEV